MKPVFITALAATISFASISSKSHAQDKGFGKTPVTLGTSAKFSWTDWTKAPQSLKDAAKLIRTNDPTPTTLYEFIQKVVTDKDAPNARVDVALIDLNNDNVLGIGILLSSRDWCGSAGCTYELYDNAGMLVVTLSDYDLKPAVNGVKSSAKKFFVMEANRRSQYKSITQIPAIFKQ